jgi:hypothetical protein
VKLTSKVRKTLDIAIRLLIATMALSYIFYRIYNLPQGQLGAFANSVLAGKGVVYTAAALLLLMVINWGIESVKWRMLIRQSEEISMGKAYQAVLGGLAVSVFTPNRVGEFIGRVFILQKTDPVKAILLTLVGSFSQLLVTVVAGTAAYVVFAPKYLSLMLFDSTWLVSGISIAMALLSLFMIFIFFNIPVLHRISILLPEKYSERIKNSIDAIAGCSKQLLLKTVLLSALRYLVFSTQFFMAIRLMGLHFTAQECLLAIPVLYLMLMAIPTVALTEIGVRGSVSVFIFGLMAGPRGLDSSGMLAIISASTLIWFLNIALPSLAGVLVVFRLKFFRR